MIKMKQNETNKIYIYLILFVYLNPNFNRKVQ